MPRMMRERTELLRMMKEFSDFIAMPAATEDPEINKQSHMGTVQQVVIRECACDWWIARG